MVNTNTRPVPNTKSPIAASSDGKILVYVQQVWSQWFQQFTQQAAAAIDVSGDSPYQANQNGTVIITGGTGIELTRGTTTINLANGQAIIPISIGDTVTWATGTVKFLGS